MASEPTLSSLAMLASSVEQAQASGASTSTVSPAQKTKEQMRRHYVRALHKVVDESDIVILVLDARDPEGCRSRLVEEEVRRRESEGKKLVFVLNKIGACVSLLFSPARTTFDGIRSRSEGKCPAVVEVSTTLYADPPISFGRVQPTIEFVVCNGTGAVAALESLQAEYSTKRDGRRGRVSERGQEQSDQHFETIQGPSPFLMTCRPLIRRVCLLFGRCAQLQRNLDIQRTCKRSSLSAASRSLTLLVSYSMKTRTTVGSANVKRVAYCSATWSKSRISTIRLLSVSWVIQSLRWTAHPILLFFPSGRNSFTNRPRDATKDLWTSRLLKYPRVSDHVGTEQRKAPQGCFFS